MMEIRIERPPNFDRIAEVFPDAVKDGVIFAFGDVIYNPSGVGIPAPLRAHEELHGKRQRAMGVQEWWDAYLKDPVFRFTEELKAHVAEYDAQIKRPGIGRNDFARIKMRTAQRLIAPLYAYKDAQPTLREALNAIESELIELYSTKPRGENLYVEA